MFSSLKNMFILPVKQPAYKEDSKTNDFLNQRLTEIENEVLVLKDNLSLGKEASDSLVQFAASAVNIKRIFSCLNSCLEEQIKSNKTLRGLVLKSNQTQAKQMQLVEKCKQETTSLDTSFKDFAASLKNIDSLAESLEKLTEHIHIVSLNASVEAARAKKSGASFSVLANEFRQLAANSLGLSKNLRTMADTVIQDTEVLSNRLTVIVKALKKLEQIASLIGDGAKTLDNSTYNIGIGLKFSILCCRLGVTCLEEMELKRLVYASMVAGKSLINLSAFPSHKQCPLGQWYLDKEVKEAFSKNQIFIDIDIPHQKTHDFAHQTLVALMANEFNEALEYLANMEVESLKVLDGLIELLAQSAQELLLE